MNKTDLIEKMKRYELKLYCVTLGYPTPNCQTSSKFVWACSEADAWNVVNEAFGCDFTPIKPYSTVTLIEPARGMISDRLPMSLKESAQEADAWDTGRKKPTDPGYIRVNPSTGEPL